MSLFPIDWIRPRNRAFRARLSLIGWIPVPLLLDFAPIDWTALPVSRPDMMRRGRLLWPEMVRLRAWLRLRQR